MSAVVDEPFVKALGGRTAASLAHRIGEYNKSHRDYSPSSLPEEGEYSKHSGHRKDDKDEDFRIQFESQSPIPSYVRYIIVHPCKPTNTPNQVQSIPTEINPYQPQSTGHRAIVEGWRPESGWNAYHFPKVLYLEVFHFSRANLFRLAIFPLELFFAGKLAGTTGNEGSWYPRNQPSNAMQIPEDEESPSGDQPRQSLGRIWR